MMKQLSEFTKSLFYLALAIFAITSAYLMYVNPNLNNNEMARIQFEKEQAALQISEKRRQWKHDIFSDVDLGNEDQKYPIVVLRTGFKVIKTNSVNTLVGWEYDVMNVSPKNTYNASVSFTLTDVDAFDIATGKAEEMVLPNSSRAIRGTISVSNDDVDRLYGSTWRVSLNKDWKKLEKNTKGKRYERLLVALPKYPPLWIKDGVKKDSSWWKYDKKLNTFVEKYGEKPDVLPKKVKEPEV